VLFDLLHRWEDAEQVALRNLFALLGREFREPLDAQYGDLVEAARTD
jgi:hypothetical protein